jgi:hypothetical protein
MDEKAKEQGIVKPNNDDIEETLRLQRLAAAAKGEEYAETIDFTVRWDFGAPLPHLFVNDSRALLAFFLSPAAAEPESLALVEFKKCEAAKLGSPNDEVLGGHPLDGKGLDFYAAQRVINSRWLAEVERINSVHQL